MDAKHRPAVGLRVRVKYGHADEDGEEEWYSGTIEQVATASWHGCGEGKMLPFREGEAEGGDKLQITLVYDHGYRTTEIWPDPDGELVVEPPAN